MTDAPPPKKDPKDYRFQPGNPGKPKGVRHKLKETFFLALTKDFQEHGADAIVAARNESALGYLRVIASILPKQVSVKDAPKEMSDAALIAVVQGVVSDDDDESEGAVH